VTLALAKNMKTILVSVYLLIACVCTGIAQTSYTFTPEERKAIEEENHQRKLLDAKLYLEIPSEYKERKGIFLVQESKSSRSIDETAYRLANATSSSITYTAYSADSPIYRVQHFVDQKWDEIQIGWCGTGLGISELPPGKSVVIFVVSEKLRGTFRVGIDLIGNENHSETVWSSEK
jgi:hypothetical protein